MRTDPSALHAFRNPLAHGALAIAAVVGIAGCAPVGPDYAGPPTVAARSIDDPGFLRARVAPVTPVPPPARWWDAVGDPLLTRLIDDAFAASPTLMSAEARVRSARSQVSADRAGLGPSRGATAGYVRGRIPASATSGFGGGGSSSSSSSSSSNSSSGSSSGSSPIDLRTYSTALDASWEIDLFGGKRRGIESDRAALDARQAAFEDAQVTLANDMAQAYARLREAQNRVVYARRTIALREQSLALTRQRREGGTAAQGDLERAEGDLAQSRAELPAIDTQVEQQLDQIALLAGREPGAYDALLAIPDDQRVEVPLPPETTPVGTPAEWLRRRPDIRQAERTLASRNATIGKNVANLFPSVSLLGILGSSGSRPADLFKGPPLWALLPSLSWNFLDIPTNLAKVDGAKADRDESGADYRRTVLAALQDANDALSRFGRQRQALVERDAARHSAERAAAIVHARYAAGTASLIDALDTDRQHVQADDQWIQARADYLVSYATLQKSLGTGWGAPPPAE